MPRILVVDDDDAVRSVIVRALSGAGHQVVEAKNGRAALACFRDAPADLVITDLFMPDGDGIEFTRRIGREFVGAKVIAVSGGAVGTTGEMLAIARRLGAVRTMVKPFELGDLLATVEEVLSHE